MFDLILQNDAGDQLTFDMNSPFTVVDLEGLNPPDAWINTDEVALIDGALFNSAKLQMRTINVAFAIELDSAKNRLAVYKVLKTKHRVKLIYTSKERNINITGYIQNIQISYWEMKQVVTVTILCPDPYLIGSDDTYSITGNIVGVFHWPAPDADESIPQIVFGYFSDDGFSVANRGDVDTGLVITLHAYGSIEDPKVINLMTSEYIGVTYSMVAGDEIIIDTRKGNKSITLISNGVKTNIFNDLMRGSTWLQLPANGAVFAYTVESGTKSDLQVMMAHSNLYEGV